MTVPGRTVRSRGKVWLLGGSRKSVRGGRKDGKGTTHTSSLGHPRRRIHTVRRRCATQRPPLRRRWRSACTARGSLSSLWMSLSSAASGKILYPCQRPAAAARSNPPHPSSCSTATNACLTEWATDAHPPTCSPTISSLVYAGLARPCRNLNGTSRIPGAFTDHSSIHIGSLLAFGFLWLLAHMANSAEPHEPSDSCRIVPSGLPPAYPKEPCPRQSSEDWLLEHSATETTGQRINICSSVLLCSGKRPSARLCTPFGPFTPNRTICLSFLV